MNSFIANLCFPDHNQNYLFNGRGAGTHSQEQVLFVSTHVSSFLEFGSLFKNWQSTSGSREWPLVFLVVLFVSVTTMGAWGLKEAMVFYLEAVSPAPHMMQSRFGWRWGLETRKLQSTAPSPFILFLFWIYLLFVLLCFLNIKDLAVPGQLN